MPASSEGAFTEPRMFVRYARGLRGFFRRPLTEAECQRRVEEQLRSRDESFLRMVEAGIFAQPSSPYRPLLHAAGAELGDVVGLVREHGVEGALERLHDVGVYVTFEEFKGRRPIERLGLSLPVGPRDFDNPLVGQSFAVRHEGSRGVPRSSTLDLVHIAQEATYQALVFESFQLLRRPYALWHPVPPALAGLNDVLRVVKLGKRVDRWFSQTQPGSKRAGGGWSLLTRTTIAAARLSRRVISSPEYVSLPDPAPVVGWLAAQVAEGVPAQLCAGPSSSVRVCRAAEEAGQDISGTFFRVSGEPFTRAKAEIIRAAGARAISHYAAAEVGWIGAACGDPSGWTTCTC